MKNKWIQSLLAIVVFGLGVSACGTRDYPDIPASKPSGLISEPQTPTAPTLVPTLPPGPGAVAGNPPSTRPTDLKKAASDADKDTAEIEQSVLNQKIADAVNEQRRIDGQQYYFSKMVPNKGVVYGAAGAILLVFGGKFLIDSFGVFSGWSIIKYYKARGLPPPGGSAHAHTATGTSARSHTGWKMYLLKKTLFFGGIGACSVVLANMALYGSMSITAPNGNLPPGAPAVSTGTTGPTSNFAPANGGGVVPTTMPSTQPVVAPSSTVAVDHWGNPVETEEQREQRTMVMPVKKFFKKYISDPAPTTVPNDR